MVKEDGRDKRVVPLGVVRESHISGGRQVDIGEGRQAQIGRGR